MKEKQLGIHFGFMAKPISEQLVQQGFGFNIQTIDSYQKCAEAISLLRINDFLPDAAYGKIRDKLYKKIERHVMQKNKLSKI